MTEDEWFSDLAARMGRLIRVSNDRSLMLATVAACRLVPHLLTHPLTISALEVAERLADGAATDTELDVAGWEAEVAYRELLHPLTQLPSIHWDENAIAGPPVVIAQVVSHIARREPSRSFAFVLGQLTRALPTEALFSTMACIFPAQEHPLRAEPAWLTSDAVALAHHIYESRDFTAMPILADALQDAGCENEDVLSHCRGSGPHVRGCWVVDLILSKE